MTARYGLADWDASVSVLRAADEVVIACHINPDGDALGSLMAAYLGLRQLGKRTFASWGTTPPAIPNGYGFLHVDDALMDPAALPRTNTFLALDCGAADRLGELEGRALESRCTINVDHHPGNDQFGTLNLVVPTASSSAELVMRLLQDCGVQIDREIATCLWTGVVTDTGRFQYSNTSPDTLRLASELLDLGVPAPDLASEIWGSLPFAYLRLLGLVLGRARLLADAGLVYSWVRLEDLEATGTSLDEAEGLIDALRSTRDADIAAIFKQQDDCKFRVSLRSRGPRSVGEIARKRGGGGHELAAGFTADDVEDAVEGIRRDLTR
ncbi:MAG: bifunctional oligoribonuclease/PAP phosphatase NrnA [Actinomycetota bacterium]|nr:bifunctional oligoribonuclease/PAP phosphatase NrnA [Actinomycetota bacterium]